MTMHSPFSYMFSVHSNPLNMQILDCDLEMNDKNSIYNNIYTAKVVICGSFINSYKTLPWCRINLLHASLPALPLVKRMRGAEVS